jgi:putative ABC transport system permease protein
LVLAIVAAQLGLMVAQLLLTVSRELVEKQLSTAVPGATELDAPALVFTAIVTGVAALIFGAGPALLAARVQLQPAVNAARWSTSSRRGLGLRTVFVAAQLALCLGLLGGAITLAQAAIRLGNVQLGFEPDGVLKSQVLLPQARYPNAESRRQVVQQILNSVGGSGHDVAIAFPHPFRPWLTQPVRRADQLVQEGVPATRVLIGGDYFGVMGIPLLQGRVFDERDRAQTDRVAVVSAALAQRLWPNGSAIGQQLRLGLDSTPALTVAGVVGNIRKTLLEENTPDVYVPFAQNPQGYTALLVRDDTSPMLLTNSVQQAVWRVDRNLPLSGVEMMTHVVAAETARHRFLGALTSAVAAFALILALIGLYGTISYDVSQRSREFAIRAAVGARNGETYRLVLLRGARFITLGITAGALLAALVTRSLSGQIPAVQALGVLPQLALALTVIALGTLALLAPARRATAVDPASLLRE